MTNHDELCEKVLPITEHPMFNMNQDWVKERLRCREHLKKALTSGLLCDGKELENAEKTGYDRGKREYANTCERLLEQQTHLQGQLEEAKNYSSEAPFNSIIKELRTRVADLEQCLSGRARFQENEALKKRLSTLLKASEGMEKALEECREYFDQMSDCDHNGINFVANEENKMLGVVDGCLADFRALKETK